MIKEIFFERKKPFTIKTVCLLGLQMLQALEKVHQIGFIHNDIKLENIILDNVDSTRLKLIDFGVSRPYLNENGEHIDFGPCSFSGNVIFSSPNSMQEVTLSRRDDLISLTYLMLYLTEGNMLFLIDDHKKIGCHEYMRDAKNKATPQSLFKSKSKDLLEFVTEIHKI